MIPLTAVTLGGLLLFSLARDFWSLLWLSLLNGRHLGDDPAARRSAGARRSETARCGLRSDPTAGLLTFVLAAIAVGEWLERADPPIILWSVAALVACSPRAYCCRPESSPGELPRRPICAVWCASPSSSSSSRPPACFQASHAAYYGFATLHWRAAGHGELVIGLLWAEGVIAEVVLFACAAAVLRRFPPVRPPHPGRRAHGRPLGVVGAEHGSCRAGPGAGAARGELRAVHLAATHYLRDRTPPELHASAQGFYAALGAALPFGLLTPIAGWLYGVGGGVFSGRWRRSRWRGPPSPPALANACTEHARRAHGVTRVRRSSTPGRGLAPGGRRGTVGRATVFVVHDATGA